MRFQETLKEVLEEFQAGFKGVLRGFRGASGAFRSNSGVSERLRCVSNRFRGSRRISEGLSRFYKKDSGSLRVFNKSINAVQGISVALGGS